jgi:hypothetical protein
MDRLVVGFLIRIWVGVPEVSRATVTSKTMLSSLEQLTIMRTTQFMKSLVLLSALSLGAFAQDATHARWRSTR